MLTAENVDKMSAPSSMPKLNLERLEGDRSQRISLLDKQADSNAGKAKSEGKKKQPQPEGRAKSEGEKKQPQPEGRAKSEGAKKSRDPGAQPKSSSQKGKRPASVGAQMPDKAKEKEKERVKEEAAAMKEKREKDGMAVDWKALLRDKDKETRRRAVQALAQMKDREEAVRVFASALADWSLRDWLKEHSCWHRGAVDVKSEAAQGLRDIGTSEAYMVLAECHDRHLRREGVRALRKIADETALRGLYRAVQDKDAETSRLAAEGLGHVGGTEAIPVLKKALNKGYEENQWEVAESLRRIGSIEALVVLLSSSSKYVRRSAVLEIGPIGSTEAIAALNIALVDLDRIVRRTALQELVKIGGRQIEPSLRKAQADPSKKLRRQALDALLDEQKREWMPRPPTPKTIETNPMLLLDAISLMRQDALNSIDESQSTIHSASYDPFYQGAGCQNGNESSLVDLVVWAEQACPKGPEVLCLSNEKSVR